MIPHPLLPKCSESISTPPRAVPVRITISFLLALAFQFGQAANAAVERSVFGKTSDGTEVMSFTLTNANGLVAKVISYGATLTEMKTPDRDGNLSSVVFGADTVDAYERGFQAASVIGRVANRIAGGKFTLDGKEYSLAINNPPNHLHGGPTNFSRRVWQGEVVEASDGQAVRFTYKSADGEEGYPGNLVVTATYTLTDDNVLRLDYTGATDKATPINLTNHAYFNLDGGGNARVYELTINADQFTVFDETNIPTGEIRSVHGTPLDFTKPIHLGARANELGENPRYDHNFVLNHDGNPTSFKFAARVEAKSSGRMMEVWTTEPGLQLYTSVLSDPAEDRPQPEFLCLETQHFPDSVHHEDFPTVILRPEEVFRSRTEFRFSW